MAIESFEELSPTQQSAASHYGCHAYLVAGPGTGKTKTLTQRIIYLIKKLHVNPKEILGLTFTRMAAVELRNRAMKASDKPHVPHISTFHSYALRNLLQNQEVISEIVPTPVRVADDYEEEIIKDEVKEILNTGSSGDEGYTKRDVEHLLLKLSNNWAKLDAEKRDWEQQFPDGAFLSAFREHKSTYGYILRSEMVFRLLKLIEQGTLDEKDWPRYVLIDEYQDLNPCELKLVEKLRDYGAEIYAAGDDDQSIYGFRGAEPDGLRNFEEIHSPAPSEKLELYKCYRCSQEILKLALRVIKSDPRRLDKKIYSNRTDGITKVLKCETGEDERKRVVNVCKWLTEQKDLPQEKILILYRSDRNGCFSTPLIDALENTGFSTHRGIEGNLFREDEGATMLAYLKLLVNPKDGLALRTILELEPGIGKQTFEKIYKYAHLSNITWSTAVERIQIGNSNLSTQVASRIKGKMESVDNKLNELHQDTSFSSRDDLDLFLESLVTRLSITDESYITQMFEMTEGSEVESLNDLLHCISVYDPDREHRIEKGSINLMTMHSSKGLQSQAVIVIGADDQIIPGSQNGTLLADERRLFYVTLTRAIDFLFITYSTHRSKQQAYTGRYTNQTPKYNNRIGKVVVRGKMTRFLEDIGVSPI